jgi:hypothetical protein
LGQARGNSGGIGYFVSGAAPLFEIGDVFDRGRRNVFQRFAREECLMAGDDHIWEREQPGEYIVGNNQARAVFEKDLFLFFVNVEAEITDLSALWASITATVSSSAPRLVLISITPVFIFSNAQASIMCLFSSVSGQCSVMMSDCLSNSSSFT